MLNESKGNMYPGVKTWNPLGGECPHKCEYCSTNSLKRYPVIQYKYSGEIRLFNDLYKLPSKPQTIFVCAQNDLFAEKVPSDIITRILTECRIWDRHTYLFQTKNPKRFQDFLGQFPTKSILCTTIESDQLHYGYMGHTVTPTERVIAMGQIEGFEKHVTIEPIMRFSLANLVRLIKISGATKVNIGADSKHNHLPEPNQGEVLALIDELKKFTVINEKRNLSRLLK